MIGNEVFEKIVGAEKALDQLNLDVAKWRASYGMSKSLERLYKQMGLLSRALKEAEKLAYLEGYIQALSKLESEFESEFESKLESKLE